MVQNLRVYCRIDYAKIVSSGGDLLVIGVHWKNKLVQWTMINKS